MVTKEKVLIIINPVSGTGKQKSVIRAVDKYLDTNNFDYDWCQTEYAHQATEISKKAVTDGYDMIIAVGGDGSVNDVVAGINGSSVKLGIIPCGSGNGLARCLKIPLVPQKAVSIINENKMKRIDTISANEKTCVSILGVGFDALVAKVFQEKPKNERGLASYAQVILNEYPKYKQQTFSIEIAGKVYRKRAMFLSCANANQFGYNALVAPNAKIDDGYMDVCIVRKIPIVLIPLTAQLLYTHNFDFSPHVEIIKTDKVTILNNDFEWINLDGEAVKLGKKIEISINHKSLSVVC